jgi:hypothetical protein
MTKPDPTPRAVTLVAVDIAKSFHEVLIERPAPGRRQFPNPPPQHGLLVPDRAIAVRGAVSSQRRASSALAEPVGPFQVPDQLAPTRRPHNLFSARPAASACRAREFPPTA